MEQKKIGDHEGLYNITENRIIDLARDKLVIYCLNGVKAQWASSIYKDITFNRIVVDLWSRANHSMVNMKKL